MRHTSTLGSLDAVHPPQPGISRRGDVSWRQDADLIAATYRAAGEFHGLGLMPLKDQAEGAPFHQGANLALEVGRELSVQRARLAQ